MIENVEIRVCPFDYDIVIRDNSLVLVPETWATDYGIKKGDEVRIWNNENGSVRHYQVGGFAVESYDQDDQLFRMGADARSRMWSYYESSRLLESTEEPQTAAYGPETLDNFQTWSGATTAGTTVTTESDVPNNMWGDVQFIRRSGLPQIANVRSALSEWSELLGWSERCAVSKPLADKYGFAVGDNIHLQHADRWNRQAPFTIYRIYDTTDVSGEDTFTVRMSNASRERLHKSSYDEGISDSQNVPNNFPVWVTKETPGNKWRSESECLVEDLTRCYSEYRLTAPSNIIITAPQSGGIELYTAEICETASKYLNSNHWVFNAHQFGGGTYDRWHITSVDIGNGFPGYEQTVVNGQNWDYPVSIHGFSNSFILIGGRASLELKETLSWHLDNEIPDSRSYDIAIAEDETEWPKFNGFSKENFINVLGTDNKGIQFELPYSARSNHSEQIAKGISKGLLEWINARKPNRTKGSEISY